MCANFRSVFRVLLAGLCLIVLGLGIGYPLVWAEMNEPQQSSQPLAFPPPARPVYGPPGPRPDEGVALTPTTAPPPPPPPAMTAPLEPVVVTIAPPPPPATPGPVRPPTCGPIADFEQFGTWKRGDEPFGTFVQAAEAFHSGMFSGRLNYSFPTPGNDYVVFMRNIPMGGMGQAITAWVYGDNSGHYLNCWVKDSAGEVWSFPFGRIQHVGWQLMSAPLNVLGAWPTGHISGPANGVLDYPINFYALVLDDAPDTYSGSGVIYIDDLSCSELGVVPQPSPQVWPSPGWPAQPTPQWPQPGPASGDCVVTLLDPPHGREFGGETRNVTLRWSFNRALAPQEYFFVNVEYPHGGATWYDGTWRDPSRQLPDGTRDTSWNLREYLCGPGFSDSGWYKWYVTVLYQLGPEKSLSDGFVCRSEKRDFKWTGCAPTPAPGGGEGEYDLYVRRMDFSTDRPVVGERVTAHIMIATDIYPSDGPYFPASRFKWRRDADSEWHEESCPENTHYASCEKTVSFSYDSSGEHNFKVVADSGNDVAETDEGNNDRKWKMTVVGP